MRPNRSPAAAGMGRAIGANEPCAIDREGDIETLQTDVVHELIIGALEEG